MEKAFHDEGMMVRPSGDTLAVTPPLIVSEAQIDEIFEQARCRHQGGGLTRVSGAAGNA